MEIGDLACCSIFYLIIVIIIAYVFVFSVVHKMKLCFFMMQGEFWYCFCCKCLLFFSLKNSWSYFYQNPNLSFHLF